MINKVAKGYRNPLGFSKTTQDKKPDVGRPTKTNTAANMQPVAPLSAIRAATYHSMIDEVQAVLNLALATGDKEEVANLYRELFSLYLEIDHPDALEIGNKAVEAAKTAHEADSEEVADTLTLLSLGFQYQGKAEQSLKTMDAAIEIFMKSSDTYRILDALEFGISSATEQRQPAKVKEYARRGMAVIKQHGKSGKADLHNDLSYFQEIFDTADDEPLAKEEQTQSLQTIISAMRELIGEKSKHSS
ncbi:MAG: tetratricopeptide repeat protein [Candidatus Obscuribacter sp.]|nr:tetratricopeptide repeat protein [Candidatus Obscuribacter sp.]